MDKLNVQVQDTRGLLLRVKSEVTRDFIAGNVSLEEATDALDALYNLYPNWI